VRGSFTSFRMTLQSKFKYKDTRSLGNFLPMYGDLFVAGDIFAYVYHLLVMTALGSGLGSVEEAIGWTFRNEDASSGDVVGE
jgi:hypothetical protein